MAELLLVLALVLNVGHAAKTTPVSYGGGKVVIQS